MFLLGIYLVNFMVVWCVYLHKLPPIGVYNVHNIAFYYGLNRFHYVFIRFHYVQNKGLCSFSCQNLSNYTKISPLMQKRLLIENFSVFCIQYTEIFIVGFFPSHPLLFSPTNFYYYIIINLYIQNFYTRDKILIVGLKKSHSYIKAFIL